MASNKIGDYIHFKYYNYKNYGLNTKRAKKSQSPPNPQGIFKEQKKRVKDLLKIRRNKDKTKKDLEAQINYFFNPLDKGGINPSDRQLEELQRQVIQILQNNKVNLSGVNIDWKTLQATGGKTIRLKDNEVIEIDRIQRTILGRDDQKYSTYSAVIRRIQDLIDIRDNLAKFANKTKFDEDFIASVTNLTNNYSKLIEQLQNEFKNKGGKIIRGYKNAESFGYKFKLEDDIKDLQGNVLEKRSKSFLKEMQVIIDSIKNITNTEVSGILGEYIPVISQYFAKQTLVDGLDTIFNQLNSQAGQQISQQIGSKVVGGLRSDKMLLKSKVVGQKRNPEPFRAKIGNIDMTSHYTQDKVDIILSLNKEEVKASVKNVNFNANPNITLLSGTSILKLFQDYEVFTNHYLNVTATKGREIQDEKPDPQLLQLAHETAKLTIGAHALIGGVWGQKQGSGSVSRSDIAEFFIVNNKSSATDRFKVYFTSDIIRKMEKNTKTFLNVDNFNDVVTYDNHWIGLDADYKSAYARIMRLLAQLHKFKLHVTIDSKGLSNI